MTWRRVEGTVVASLGAGFRGGDFLWMQMLTFWIGQFAALVGALLFMLPGR